LNIIQVEEEKDQIISGKSVENNEICEFDPNCDPRKTLANKNIDKMYPTISHSSTLVFNNKFNKINNNNISRSHENIY